MSISTETLIRLSGIWTENDFHILSTKAGKDRYENIVIEAGCQIADNARMSATFRNCTRLNSFTIEDGVEAKVRLENTFAGCTALKSIDLSNLNITSSTGAFTGCTSLRYIYINEGGFTGTNDFGNVTSNLLIYGNGECPKGWSGMNFISGNTAKSITLEHGKPFFCPRSFTAENISYTRTFGKESGINDLAGYEALVLPFTPQTYTTDGNRTLAPWDEYDLNPSAYNVPFWLMQAKGGSNIEVAEMTANEPYLVCFPNNSRYSESVNVKGAVTF